MRTHPRVRAVTAGGDLVGADWAVGGQTDAPSSLVVRARVDEAEAELAARDRPRRRRSPTSSPPPARRRRPGRPTSTRRSPPGRPPTAAGPRVAAELAELGAAARSAAAEAERHLAARVRAEQALEQAQTALAALEQRLAEAEAAPVEEEPSTEERDRLRAEVAAARQAETEARLAVRTAEERARALHGRAESLRRQARQERAARERAAAARVARERGAARGRAACAPDAEDGARRARDLPDARGRRAGRRSPSARTAQEAELLEVRARVRAATAELDRLTDEVHRDEVARAEQRYRIEALEGRAAEEYGVDLPTLLAEYGPAAPVPPTPQQVAAAEAAGEPEPDPVPYDRAVQERRAAKAERDLATLGKVNPLALEEFAALEERHGFLATQLEDLKSTRRDLLTVVREVDERIHDVFAAAFADVQREFERRLRHALPRRPRAGWSSPSPTTCSPPASRSRRGRRARRSSGSRCCPAASGR